MQFASNWLLLAVSEKTRDFSWKTKLFFKKKPIFQRFEKSYYFNCILQQIFSKNQSMFFQRKPNFRTFLRYLTNSIAVSIKLIAFSGFQKNSRFFWKTSFFFETKPIFQRFEKSYYFSCILQQIFIFGGFKKTIFFRKTHLFYLL